MTTNAGLYPVWRCDPLLLCADELEFKFVILQPDGNIVWEERANRHLTLTGAEEANVIADWNSADANYGMQPLMASLPAPPSPNASRTRMPVATRGPPEKACPSSPMLGTSSGRGLPPIPGSGGGTPLNLSGCASDEDLAANGAALAERPDQGLVERLLVVEHHLPFLLWKDDGGAWA